MGLLMLNCQLYPVNPKKTYFYKLGEIWAMYICAYYDRMKTK